MQQGEKIEFYQKRQFGDKLNMVIVFLRQNAWPFVKAQLFITGPILLLANLLMTQNTQDLLDFAAMAADPTGFIGNMFEIYAVYFLMAIISGSLLPTVAYSYMRSYQEKGVGEIQIRDLTARIGRKFPAMLGYSILTSVISVIGLFFFVIPGIYLFVVLSIGTAVIMFEDTDPFTALSRVFKLIKDKWFSTLGLIVVTYIISMLISMLFSLPQTIAYGAWVFNSIDTTTGALDTSDMPQYVQGLNVVFALFSTFGTLISYSVIYLALAFQYFNLVERQESRGLMSQIQELESSDNQTEEEDESY